jgi:hypothetical protein
MVAMRADVVIFRRSRFRGVLRVARLGATARCSRDEVDPYFLRRVEFEPIIRGEGNADAASDISDKVPTFAHPIGPSDPPTEYVRYF